MENENAETKEIPKEEEKPVIKEVKEIIKPTSKSGEKRKKPPANGVPKAKKKKTKTKREEGAPRMPLTGYVRYMNERRDSFRAEYPDKTANEHTKMIAEEWNKLTEEQKKPYLQAAEVDKERYIREMNEFNKKKDMQKKMESQTDATTSPTTNGVKPLASTEKSQFNGNETINTAKFPRRPAGTEQGIPIFTEEFLEHNKTVDLELRTLRKSNIDYEQQNSVLEKHIENMKFGVEKVENENIELIEKNQLLQAYLDKFKIKLAQALSGLAIPTQPNGATVENIDNYMQDLYNMATSNSHGPASLNKAKDIIRKLDFQIQL